MALIPIEQLNRWIEASGAPLVGTQAVAAYLESLLPQITPDKNTRIRAGLAQTQPGWPTDAEWLTRSQPWTPPASGWLHEVAQEDGYIPEPPSEIPADLQLVVRRIIDTVVHGYTTSMGWVNYDLSTLTPWEIARAIVQSEFLAGIFEISFIDDRLPVSVRVHGNTFTHWLTMDTAIGIFLFGHVSQVNFEMTLYGAPLTYLMEGQDDVYKRYDEDATEGERWVQMLGIERRYYFRGDDLLLGIKTAAQWLGVNHRHYCSCWDVEGRAFTF
jgi:hypothetical protein